MRGNLSLSTGTLQQVSLALHENKGLSSALLDTYMIYTNVDT